MPSNANLYFTYSVFASVCTFLLFTSMKSLLVVEAITSDKFVVMANTRYATSPISAIAARSKINCAMKCKQMDNCKAANYQKPHCELLEHDAIRVSELVTVQGWYVLCKYIHSMID